MVCSSSAPNVLTRARCLERIHARGKGSWFTQRHPSCYEFTRTSRQVQDALVNCQFPQGLLFKCSVEVPRSIPALFTRMSTVCKSCSAHLPNSSTDAGSAMSSRLKVTSEVPAQHAMAQTVRMLSKPFQKRSYRTNFLVLSTSKCLTWKRPEVHAVQAQFTQHGLSVMTPGTQLLTCTICDLLCGLCT